MVPSWRRRRRSCTRSPCPLAAARFLGAEALGRQSFISFVALSVAMLVGGGFPLALGRYVGATMGRAHPGRVRGLIAWAWKAQGLLAFVGGAILVGVALAGADPQAAWVLAAVGTLDRDAAQRAERGPHRPAALARPPLWAS